MPGKFAIDFGTTNTVIARWNEATGAAETVRLDGLGAPPSAASSAPAVPSLVYIRDARTGDVLAGQQVRSAGYNIRSDPRFFSAFKRPLVSAIQGLPREMDGVPVTFAAAGKLFVRAVLRQLIAQKLQPDELVVTLPVDAFELYTDWLDDAVAELEADAVHVVDESTAAALGYEAAGSDAPILVFDFGGGTLDVSLVRLGSLASDRAGHVLRDRKGRSKKNSPATTARVIAKAGCVLGGEDIDQWLAADLLSRHGVLPNQVRDMAGHLKVAAEEVKIALSTSESAEFSVFDPTRIKTYSHNYTRGEFEEVLDRHGFYRSLQDCLRKVLRQAEGQGLTEDSLRAVLMVGGTSLIPSVQRAVAQNFPADRLRSHKPFEAVAHGALSVAAGIKIEDHLYHSYGFRHWNPITQRREYEPFLRSGTSYPLEQPIEKVLAAAHPNQRAIELVVGEITEDSSLREIVIEDGRIIAGDTGATVRKVVALNDKEGARTVAVLDPPGVPGVDRIKVIFGVDRKRTLRLTVEDLLTRKKLLEDVRVIELR